MTAPEWLALPEDTSYALARQLNFDTCINTQKCCKVGGHLSLQEDDNVRKGIASEADSDLIKSNLNDAAEYIHSFEVGRVGDEELFDVIHFKCTP